jgi:hypothetical protein
MVQQSFGPPPSNYSGPHPHFIHLPRPAQTSLRQTKVFHRVIAKPFRRALVEWTPLQTPLASLILDLRTR